MAYPQGIDFRGTADYVTDPANCNAEVTPVSANYPRVTPQGNTVGWEQAPNNAFNRAVLTGDEAKMSGVAVINSGSRDYRFDVPPGQYSVRVAAGDMVASGNGIGVEVFDDVTSRGVLIPPQTFGGSQRFLDASNVLHLGPSDWVANNQPALVQVDSGILRFRLSFAGAQGAISHLWVESAGGPPPSVASGSLNDAINAAIPDVVGGDNSINGKLLRHYKANGATSNDLQDAEYQFLKIAHPFGTAPQTNQDLWYAYLYSSGYSGALQDMKLAYWTALIP
jgi:hypothetical protein